MHDLAPLLVPASGWIIVAASDTSDEVELGFGSIEVEFAPFKLPGAVAAEWDEDSDTPIETSLRLAFIEWPGVSDATLPALANRSFAFPRNPDPGYIEGTVYLLHQHQMADVTEIVFGDIVDGVAIDATLTVDIDLDDTGFADVRGARLRARLVERRK